jgi:putative ABC transport system ATP-binding protein
VKGVTKTYRDNDESVTVLSDVSLDLPKRTVATVCGPSGSGKTTLLNIIAGLDQPDSGEVWFENTRMDKADEKTKASLRARSIGIIFQNPNLFSYLSALENVLLPTLFFQDKGVVYKQEAQQLLGILGLSEKSNRYPARLSEGEKKRVSIARALVTKPKLILADEPTSNLDSENSQAVIELIRREVKEGGGSALISTHDEQVAKKSDASFRIRFGKIESEPILRA